MVELIEVAFRLARQQERSFVAEGFQDPNYNPFYPNPCTNYLAEALSPEPPEFDTSKLTTLLLL